MNKIKHTIIILLVLIIVSCSQKSKHSKKNPTNSETITNLDSTIRKLDFYSDSILTHIDAEELCEFSFDFFLPQLNQKLAVKNLKLEVKTANDFESSFEITINGHFLKLYKNDEISNGKFWNSGPRNFFRIVNEILRDENIDEQFYLLYSGNDLHAAFLTKQEFELISKKNEDEKNEIPYLP